jgi:hypothetical protein
MYLIKIMLDISENLRLLILFSAELALLAGNIVCDKKLFIMPVNVLRLRFPHMLIAAESTFFHLNLSIAKYHLQ